MQGNISVKPTSLTCKCIGSTEEYIPRLFFLSVAVKTARIFFIGGHLRVTLTSLRLMVGWRTMFDV